MMKKKVEKYWRRLFGPLLTAIMFREYTVKFSFIDGKITIFQKSMIEKILLKFKFKKFKFKYIQIQLLNEIQEIQVACRRKYHSILLLKSYFMKNSIAHGKWRLAEHTSLVINCIAATTGNFVLIFTYALKEWIFISNF